MNRYPFLFKEVLRRLELEFMGKSLIFHLDLSAQDIGRFKRLWFAYLQMRDLEGRAFSDLAKKKAPSSEVNHFLESFLEESFCAQERVASFVSQLLLAGKIQLASYIEDAEGVVLTAEILANFPLFYELRVKLGEHLSLWEENLSELVKKKPFWQRWFERT